MLFTGAESPIECAVYELKCLATGARIMGPAIIEDEQATCVVPSGARVRLDELGMLAITLKD